MPNKNILLIIGLLILISLGVILGLRLSLKQKPQPTPPQSVQAPAISQPTQAPQQKQEPIDTSNWKTYRNEEYGFEVRYPTNWEVEESNLFVYEDKYMPSIEFGEKVRNYIRKRVNIVIYKNFKDLPDSNNFPNLSSWLSTHHSLYLGNYLSPDFLEIKFGVDNYSGIMKQESTTIAIPIIINSLFVEKSGQVINVRGPFIYRVKQQPDGTWLFDADYSSLAKIFKQILTTFKFIK